MKMCTEDEERMEPYGRGLQMVVPLREINNSKH